MGSHDQELQDLRDRVTSLGHQLTALASQVQALQGVREEVRVRRLVVIDRIGCQVVVIGSHTNPQQGGGVVQVFGACGAQWGVRLEGGAIGLPGFVAAFDPISHAPTACLHDRFLDLMHPNRDASLRLGINDSEADQRPDEQAVPPPA